MARINGWTRKHHYSNLEDAKENLDIDGRVRIGVWTHNNAGTIEHIYEPGAKKEFIVRVTDSDREFEEEGHYKYRYQGDQANKAVMRKYP